MSNTLTSIMPKILARGLMVLREKCIFPRLVNSSYSNEAKSKGNTIDIPIPTAVGTRDVSPSNTLISPSDTTTKKVSVSLDRWKQNDPIYLTDKQLVEIDKNRHFLPGQLEEAVKALAVEINTYLAGLYISSDLSKGIYGYVGTAGITPFASTVSNATEARRELNKQLCPGSDRNGVLDFDAGANALDLSPFSDAEKIGSNGVKIDGEIGRKFGIGWVEDDDVVTHTAGTIADASATRTCAINNGAGYAAAIAEINVDNGAEASVTGTIVVGDIISFAGHSQTYCVIANSSSSQYSTTTEQYTFASNAITGLKFYPGLKSAVVDDEVATVVASHVVNLVFHRDAFAFAMRPLVEETGALELGSRILSYQDDKTGIVLRLEVSRQHKQVVWEFDVLYGGNLVRPELACRLAG